MTLAFEAAQRDDAREQLTLWRITTSRLPFGKPKREAVAFEDWVLNAPDAARAATARVLQAWADDERTSNGALLVEASGDSATLDPALIAQFGEADAIAMGLPGSPPLFRRWTGSTPMAKRRSSFARVWRCRRYSRLRSRDDMRRRTLLRASTAASPAINASAQLMPSKRGRAGSTR